MLLISFAHIFLVFLPETLGLVTPDYYFYLNQSGAYKVDGTNDAKEFKDTLVGFFTFIFLS